MIVVSIITVLGISIGIPKDKRIEKYLNYWFKNLNEKIKEKLEMKLIFLPITDDKIYYNFIDNESTVQNNRDIVIINKLIHNFYEIAEMKSKEKVIDVIVKTLIEQ